MKLLLILLLCLVLGVSQNGLSQTIHAIIVADTKNHSPEFATGCTFDVDTMNNSLQLIADGIRYKLSLTVVKGDDFNRAKLDQTLNAITAETNDIVLLYYTGHGFNREGREDKFPYLVIENGKEPAIRDLHKLLVAKNARMTITIADACNNILPFPTSRGATPRLIPKGATTTEDYNKILQKLFAETAGDIMITSSTPPEQSCMYSNLGSFFTRSFNAALFYASKLNSEITWETLLEDTQTRLSQMTARLAPKREQHSIYEINLSQKSTPTNDVVTYDQINKFLNELTNESIDYYKRKELAKTYTKFFLPTTNVKYYTNNTGTGTDKIENLLNRLILNAKKIQQVNFVEKLSKLSGKQYSSIAICEIWDLK